MSEVRKYFENEASEFGIEKMPIISAMIETPVASIGRRRERVGGGPKLRSWQISSIEQACLRTACCSTGFFVRAVLLILWCLQMGQLALIAQKYPLWDIYSSTLKTAKYVDLTHAFSPVQPVWPGFGEATFGPTVAGKRMPGYIEKGEAFTIAKQGFRATAYTLPSDQYGTQLDPPAHWNPVGATISDLPPTFAIRPLVVISIADRVKTDPGYSLTVKDVEAWEKRHGRVPEGSVVMVRSDWYKKWRDIQRFTAKPFPGVSLPALKFLHLERKILFHGHEPLDTDDSEDLEGEAWLMHNNFSQAEGVRNLDLVPEAGALVIIGYAKPLGGTGGFARYIAVCPSDWPHGVSVDEAPGAPLPTAAEPLKRDAHGVLRAGGGNGK